jgi:hypothetical protein
MALWRSGVILNLNVQCPCKTPYFLFRCYSFIDRQCCGSGMFIPDPGSDFFPSRIPDQTFFHPGSRILKEFKYFNPQKSKKKWFLSSKKYDPGCSSRIPDPDADFFPSRIPGSKRYPIPDPGSGSATLLIGDVMTNRCSGVKMFISVITAPIVLAEPINFIIRRCYVSPPMSEYLSCKFDPPRLFKI